MSNFYIRIADAARRFGSRPALEMVTDAALETWSYAELVAAIDDCSRWLVHAAGVTPGDRVAILAPNGPRWVAAYLAVLRIGAIAVPLDTAYDTAQVRTILIDCGACAIFTVDRHLEVVARATESLEAPVPLIAQLTQDFASVGSPPAVAPVTTDEAAVILYTSGTTADPKGVLLTHGNLEAERAGALDVIHVTETDAVLGVLPLFHALAQMTNLLLPLTTGARVVFLDPVSSTTLLQALATRGITVFACVPQFFYLIHQRVTGEIARKGAWATRAFRLLLAVHFRVRAWTGLNAGRLLFGRVHRALGPQIRLLITGGSRFDPAIARDLYSLGITLLNGYGLTETSGAATVMRPGEPFNTSVGPPLPGVEIRIASHDSAPSGEILIRGPIVMREYFRRPDATGDALRAGWLHTGDLGYLDERGRVHITGRLKEIIVLSSGKNLYPEELEAHYARSPFIRELCILGVTKPGEPASERLHAIVVPDADVLRARGIVNLRELIRFEIETLSVQMPAHKRILSYDIHQQPLSRTTTGKLKRGAIAAQHATSSSAMASPRSLTEGEQVWLRSPSHAALIAQIERQLRRPVAPDANLELDLGLDSMERVELLSLVEATLKRHVPVDQRATIFTLRQLVEAVEQAPSTAGVVSVDPGELLDAGWESLLAGRADAAVEADLRRSTVLRTAIVGGALALALLALRLVIRLQVTGQETLPGRGPYILCPNHQSHFDGFLLAATVPFGVLRQLFLVGASEYFDTPFAARAARFLNIVPVDPDANLVSAMRAAASGLRRGKVLLLFPEGERTIDGRVRPFRKGAAILAAHLQVPLIPVAVDGLFDVWPRGRGINWRLLRPWRRAQISVRFGDLLHISPGDPAEGTSTLQQRVTALLNGPTLL